MSLKAILYIETKKKSYEVLLSTLTTESLTASVQKLVYSARESESESESDSEGDQQKGFEITDKNNVRIKKDEDVERAYKDGPAHFNVRIKPKKYIKRKGQMNIQPNHIMVNPLVVLAGTIRNEASDEKLNSVKRDLMQLKRLFEMKYGYTVMSTYDEDDCASEILTFNRLNKTLSDTLEKIKNEISATAAYDGLIFVWCGYGNDETGTIITSDSKCKHWNEIANVYEDTRARFTKKPKEKSCEMKADEIISWNRLSGSNVLFLTTNSIKDDPTGNTGSIFTKLFCEQLNEENSLQISMNSMIEDMNYMMKDKFENESGQRLIKTCSSCDRDIYFGARRHFSYGYIEDTDANWIKAIKKAEALMTKMMEQNQKGIIVVASNLDDALTHSKGWTWELEEDVSMKTKEEQSPMKQKHFVGAFTIALFHCKSVRFQEIIIYGCVYVVHCHLICEDAYITNHVFHTGSTSNCTCNEPVAAILLSADFNQMNQLASTTFSNKHYRSTIGYLRYALVWMEQNPHINPKPDNHALASLYQTLGRSYLKIKEYKKALCYFEKELEMYSTQSDVMDIRLRNCFYNLGITLYELNQFDKSIHSLERSLSIWLAKFNINHKLVGELYTELSLLPFLHKSTQQSTGML
ncbi:hypothetical protein RFI_37486 [Reticulomyxa filosa]|uniref:Uncharacterized protein n=1 Tax=Reticulomyxa filosa TaxID=46433 RepID=X6LFS2_RETFI|nr:hypothetical protein RFI_37486 [Reticulomyxa filosa]|eukprot:ETN99971.1 hypothetical protein RFI_37486 [Reticulomyxa filosa]